MASIYTPSTVIGSAPRFIRSRSCVPMAFTAKSPPASALGDAQKVKVLAQDTASSIFSPDGEGLGFAKIASKAICPADFFGSSPGGAESASGRVPIAWKHAPGMAVVLEMRLKAEKSRANSGLRRGNSKLPAPFDDVEEARELELRPCSFPASSVHTCPRTMEDIVADSVESIPPLTGVEVVIVKDSYNKALAWMDVVLEMVVERLFCLVPTLPSTLGGLTPHLKRYLHGILDLSVRSLDPSTESVSRESYKALHPHCSRPHQDIDGYVQTLAEQGFLVAHWEAVRDLWVEALKASPYMEDYERQNMELGTGGATYRFFTLHVLRPVVSAIVAAESYYGKPSNAKLLADSWAPYAASADAKRALGMEIHERLFTRYPDLLPLFEGADVVDLSKHLGESLEAVAKRIGDTCSVAPVLRRLAAIHANLRLPSSVLAKMDEVMMDVLSEALKGASGESEASRRLRELWEKAWRRAVFQVRLPTSNAEELVAKAHEWIDQIAHELRWDQDYVKARKGHIYTEVINRGTYWHTTEELEHGARVCWRNSAKCIGRIAWKTLEVRDRRRVSDLGEMFAECLEHQRVATGDGSIKAVMTVFRPQAPGERMGTRFWNQQMTRYAAYVMEDGSVMGDAANLELTEVMIANGWMPPEPRGAFDVLPVVLETSANEIRMFDIPRQQQYCREVHIEHPTSPAFGELGLKWAAVPTITNFTMNLGGINYTACPFNGWFMNTEIARDLMEDGRCGRSLEIAESLGIHVSEADPFWKDRAFLELNCAVVHSFRRDAVTIVDHHTASQQFMCHDLREKRVGRECPAQWSWIVPPLGGSLTSVFHHEMRHFDRDPRFVYQAAVYRVKRCEHTPVGKGMKRPRSLSKKRLLVLYGSETGTAEGYAFDTAERLRSSTCQVTPLDDVQPSDLKAEHVHAVLVVMSTFGDGEMPQGARGFYEKARVLRPGALAGVSYSLMALGSSAYPNFCNAGKTMDELLHRLGAERLCDLHLGDAVHGQAQSVRDWQNMVCEALGVGHLAHRTINGYVTSEDSFSSMRGGSITFLESNSTEVREVLNDTSKLIREGFSLCPVTTNDELLNPATRERSVRSIGIDLRGNASLAYETGDHVTVVPSNDPAVVAGTLSWIGARPDQWFTVVEGDTRPSFSVPTTVARAFADEVDLSTREPIGRILELLRKRSTASSEKNELQGLQERQGRPGWDEIQKGFLNKHTTILSVLQAFPSAIVTAEDLLLTLPTIRPRHYSISSAAELHPCHLYLTVGVLKIHSKQQNTIREGLCSNFLARQSPGQRIRVALRPSSFRSPPDLAASPVIMVGAGTGISPMLGFLEARQKAQSEGTPLAQCLVYFGCRDTTEFLYSDRMIHWHRLGVITALNVATSREGVKAYVQHLIAQEHLKIWQFLRHPLCHVYVCGNSAMAEEVKAEIMMAAHRCGRMDPAAVVNFFETMTQEGRFQSDTWGVGLPASSALETFVAEVEAKE